MGLETATYISDLVPTNPTSADPISQGDDHLRTLKSTLKNTFPNVTGIVSKTQAELNSVTDRGLIAGQTWTGTHTFPATTYGVTASLGASGSGYATLDFVNNTISSAALPGQVGHTDELFTTNGTIASWTTKINDGKMRFANAADSTKLMAFSLSGLTTGTTRIVTMPDKNGIMAMTSDLGLILLATLTPTAAANIDFLSTFSINYDNYLIIADGLIPASTDNLQIRFANGGVVDTASNYADIQTVSGSTTTLASSITINNTVISGGKGGNIIANILNVNDASNGKSIRYSGISQANASPTLQLRDGAGFYINSSMVSGFRLYWNGGANFIATGKVRVYGYQNS